ncbi:MAG: cysteine methyltransferase [Porticoccaceae bacterium]|nr:cysteine methyltransferase [Porticoccaceae bacterium]
MFCDLLPSPLGDLTICADGLGVTAVAFPGEVESEVVPNPNALVCEAAAQLADYFAGRRTRFDLPLNPAGTLFQQRVWQALCAVPYGDTASYGEIAAALGNPRASRAVGLANGRNPIAILVPCHRIIGGDGSLTGYGGGLERKRWLLDHERRHGTRDFSLR